jgi:hypothetical protein
MFAYLNQAGLTFYPESAEESGALRVLADNLKIGVPPELQGGGTSGTVEPVQDGLVVRQELQPSGPPI